VATAKENPRSVRPDVFPRPEARYSEQNESQFRREVERALQEMGGSNLARSDELADDADLLLMARVGDSTYDSVQDMQNIFHSSGWVSGGVVSDGGSNTVDVTAGTGFIRATDSRVVTLLFFDWPAVTGLSVPSDTTRYVGVQYNSGTPQAFVKTTDTWDYNTEFPLYSVVNEGGTLHLLAYPHAVGDHANFMIQRLWETARVAHASGATLGETGTRNVTLTAGIFWAKLNRYTTAAQDTSSSDTFDSYYRDGAGGHTKVASETQWDNNSYDDGSGTLASMTVNRYGNLWFYMESDGQLVCMYGYSNTATLAGALEEAPPSDLPDRLLSHSILVGRIVYQNGGGTASEIQSAFETTFAGTGVTDHGNLAGLADDDHTQYPLADGSRGFTAVPPGTAFVLAFSSGTTALSSSPEFLGASYIGSWSTTKRLVPVDMTVVGISCIRTTGTGVGESITWTVFDNNVATSVAVTMGASSGTDNASSTANTHDFDAGDKIGLEVTHSGSPGQPTRVELLCVTR
jgi:hypothetical protein